MENRPSQTQLNILYGCDNNYAPYTGVSMTSLFENNKEIDQITVYFAAQNISAENRGKFLALAQQYGRKLLFLDTKRAEDAIMKLGCKSWNGSLAAWLRFFVLDQIPDNVERLYWIDSDTIVSGSLIELCTLDYHKCPVACVCDALCYYQRFKLGFGIDDPYFNSGVIGFNMPKWRQDDLIDSMLQNLEINVLNYDVPDQDMLNDFLYKKIARLPMKYNFQGTHLAYDTKTYFSVYPWRSSAYYTPAEVDAAAKDPVIIHFFRFLGDYPWQQGDNLHPARQIYLEWLQKSLWVEDAGAPARRDVLFRCEKTLYKLLPRGVFLRFFAWYTNRHLPKKPLNR